MTYLNERFPIPVYLLLAGGLSLSGAWIVGRNEPTSPLAVFVSFAAILIFFAELRLMDELKDYAKDKIAHPERPLPRGLLSRTEVARAIQILFAVLLGLSVAIALVGNVPGGASLAATSVYLWLMYREFYIGESLSRTPLLYAASHQAILLILCSYALTVVHPERATTPLNLYFGLLILGAFFAYEICRKLDPDASPVLQTYLKMYGPSKTAALVWVALAIAAFAAQKLGFAALLWPVEALLAGSLALIYFRPEKYKWVETVASLSLIAHMWAGALNYWWAH